MTSLPVHHLNLRQRSNFVASDSCTAVKMKSLLMIVLITHVTADQSITVHPVDAIVDPGADVNFDCVVQDRTGRCSWTKDGQFVGKRNGKYIYEREPNDGDCAIHIRTTHIDEDDGVWVCHVSSVTIGKSPLTSNSSLLTVTNVPDSPQVFHDDVQVSGGGTVELSAGTENTFDCIVRNGNPAAEIEWEINGLLVTDGFVTTITANTANPKTKDAKSTLTLNATKDHDKQVVSCLSKHRRYPSGIASVIFLMNVKYAPVVMIHDNNEGNDIVVGDSVVLECKSEGQPRPSVFMKRDGDPDPTSSVSYISIASVNISDGGSYSCYASNEHGNSTRVYYILDVKYAPKNVQMNPSTNTTVSIGDKLVLNCSADGNPNPSYEWRMTKIIPQVSSRRVSSSAEYSIDVESYYQQGYYQCLVKNNIIGIMHLENTEGILITVEGPPEVLETSSINRKRIHKLTGETFTIMVLVCSNPPISNYTWTKDGADIIMDDRIKLVPLEQAEGYMNCFLIGLNITDAEVSDTGNYVVNIENPKGSDDCTVKVAVRGALLNQSFSQQPSDVVVMPTESTTLSCMVHHIQGICIWFQKHHIVDPIAGKYVYESDPNDGNCSLTVYDANLDHDDDLWHCQVSSVHVGQRPLVSDDAKLTVFHEQTDLYLVSDDGTRVDNASVVFLEGVEGRVHCISRQGNPPATIEFHVNGTKFENLSTTTVEETSKPKTFRVNSTFSYTFVERNEETQHKIVCTSRQIDKAISVETNVVVTHGSKLTQIRPGDENIVEGDPATIEVSAIGNPEPDVSWRKVGSEVDTAGNKIVFENVTRNDSGNYMFTAVNNAGSAQLVVQLDVQYPVQIISTEPEQTGVVAIGQTTNLTCMADGNPVPTYQWMMHKSNGQMLLIGNESSMVLDATTYDVAGNYSCIARNNVNGIVYTDSKSIYIDIKDGPTLLRDTSTHELTAKLGTSAVFVIHFCADPFPNMLNWIMNSDEGSVAITTKNGFTNDTVSVTIPHNDCYETKLYIEEVLPKHGGVYTCTVSNDAGNFTHNVSLHLDDCGVRQMYILYI